MKRVLLFLVLCLSYNFVCGQKLVTTPIDNGDFYEIYIKNFDKDFEERFSQDKLATLSTEKIEERANWRKECADRFLTKTIIKHLKEALKTDAGLCLISFFFDEEGKVITVKFTMSASVYVRFTTKMLRELFNKAIEETVNPSWYSFQEGKTYAIDAVELMQRLEGEK